MLKGAAIGAGAYGVYKLGQLSTRFDGFGNNGFGGGFNDWNDWREADGMLCRKNSDCNWLDRNMYCQDYELNFSPNVIFSKKKKKKKKKGKKIRNVFSFFREHGLGEMLPVSLENVPAPME